jgi:hypothetical protein
MPADLKLTSGGGSAGLWRQNVIYIYQCFSLGRDYLTLSQGTYAKLFQSRKTRRSEGNKLKFCSTACGQDDSVP